MRRVQRLLALLLGLFAAAPAAAHSLSTSTLTVTTDRAWLHVEWEIALRDLDYAIGLDPTGVITWGDLKRREAAIETYALPRLTLSSDHAVCPPGPVTLLADERGGNGYAVLRFTARCPAAVHKVDITYGLMFDLDPEHRALLDVISGASFHVAVLSPDHPHVAIDSGGRLAETFAEFFTVGVDHILSGPDHLLFIALLLFPAMFRRAHGAWQPVARFRPAFFETVRILSAFTIAHAITVTAATLGWVDIPSRIIEGAIALTIVATALDNIVPVLPERRWVLAFGFGLIHGMGFASALGPLSLPALPLAAALISFNLGVEAAQMLAAIVVLPVGFLLRNVRLYPARFLPGASGLAGLVALAWFARRTL
jgi:hypothetical protein